MEEGIVVAPGRLVRARRRRLRKGRARTRRRGLQAGDRALGGDRRADMRMRDATLEDLASIVEIYNSIIPGRIVSADTEPVSVEQRLPWFYEHDPARRPILVAEEDGEVVGWISLGDFWDGRPAYNGTAEIGIYIKEGHRGRGIGTRMLEEAIGRAPDLGIKTLTAGAFAGNELSLRLFERFGFERWAYFPRVAELDGNEQDLVVLGLRLEAGTAATSSDPVELRRSGRLTRHDFDDRDRFSAAWCILRTSGVRPYSIS